MKLNDCNHNDCSATLCRTCEKSKYTCEFYLGSNKKPMLDCKTCHTKNTTERTQAKKDSDPAYRMAYNEKMRDYNARQTEEARLARQLKIYGITVDDYWYLLKAQDGRCAICSEIFEASEVQNGRRLHIDHDHITKVVRGLLCVNCNLMLGHSKDDPSVLISAAQYLLKHGAV